MDAPRPSSAIPYVLSALLWALAGPSYPYVRLEFLAWVWMVPMLLALRPVESLGGVLWRVYLTLLLSFAFIMSWVAVASPVGFVIAAFISAAVFTVPFVCLHFARRAFGWRAALLSLPFVWTAWEWLFHRTELSFGAIEMGQSQANLYWLIQYADITGVWGIAFWLALFNALVTLAVGDWRTAPPRASRPPFRTLASGLAKVFALMLLPPLAYSAFVFLGETRRAQSGREISALLVQTNINPYTPLDGDGAAYRIGRAAALTRRALVQERPDLVVWPEGTVLQLWSLDSEARNNVRREVARWQTPLLTGVIDARRAAEESRGGTQSAAASYEFFNGAVMLTPSAVETQRAGNTSAGTRDVRVSEPYYRRVLMPFVERVPYKERFPFSLIPALKMDETSPGLTPGQRATVFDFPDRGGRQVTTAAVICYEQLYPAETAEFVRGGAQVLAFLTNQGWFSKTHGPYELAALSRIRSIETRRSALRAANTGVTWVVDAYGRVQAEVPWWSEQTLRVNVRLSDELTLYVRYTDYLPKACLCVSLALFLAAAWKRVRLRPRATEHVVGELKI